MKFIKYLLFIFNLLFAVSKKKIVSQVFISSPKNAPRHLLHGVSHSEC